MRYLQMAALVVIGMLLGAGGAAEYYAHVLREDAATWSATVADRDAKIAIYQRAISASDWQTNLNYNSLTACLNREAQHQRDAGIGVVPAVQVLPAPTPAEQIVEALLKGALK